MTGHRAGSAGLLARTLEAAIGAYQRLVSPLLWQRCRFAPSCSDYAKESIHRFGALYGSWLAIRRLLRCQPFCAGGWDPPPLERRRPHLHRHVPGQSQRPSQSTTTGATR
jgi:putative membrane protein insertion efficiency factor